MAGAAAPADIFEALRQSHAVQRSLCTTIMRTRASNTEGRVQALFELRIELAAHAAAEERFLYAPILMDDLGLDPSRHALSEHHEMDELLESIDELATGGDAWSARLVELVHRVRHHLKEEETRFFQMAGRILSERSKKILAGRYLRDYARMKRKLVGGR